MVDLTDLALQAGAGDRVALDTLVRAVQADVWRYARAMVGPVDADDVAQDALLRVLRAMPGFRGESTALVWVMSIARRASVDWLRGSYRRQAMVERLRSLPAEPSVLHGSLAELTDVLASLDVDRREAFVLTQVLGWTYADAAAVCDCPIGTIRSRVARARLDLLGQLDDRAVAASREPS